VYRHRRLVEVYRHRRLAEVYRHRLLAEVYRHRLLAEVYRHRHQILPEEEELKLVLPGVSIADVAGVDAVLAAYVSDLPVAFFVALLDASFLLLDASFALLAFSAPFLAVCAVSPVASIGCLHQ
jgi:hypothetical protein